MKNFNFLLILILLDVVFTKNLIKYEEIDSISIIKFTKPQNNNEFDIEFLNQLNDILDSITTKNTNVLVITGEGDKFFSMGYKSNEKTISEYFNE